VTRKLFFEVHHKYSLDILDFQTKGNFFVKHVMF